jgi:hypothetical protein
MVDLNTLIPAGSSLQLTYAVAINDRGEIAGFGVPPGVLPEEYETKGHAYILLPCDDDHPGIEGCDYTLVNENALSIPVAVRAVSAQERALPPGRRNTRSHFPGPRTLERPSG